MKISRFFFYDEYKGARGYLQTQKKYEIARTILCFFISGSLFAAGWITTGNRANLLTIVAVLGCLPACRSLVSMIMFLRYKGCSPEDAERIESCYQEIGSLYDLVFTSQSKNYPLSHMAVRGNTLCGFTRQDNFEEQAFQKHISEHLKKDNFKDVTVKVFRDLEKYTERLEELSQLPPAEKTTLGIMGTLKSISL